MESGLVGVRQPGPTGDRQDTLRAMHADTEQLHRSSAKVSGGRRSEGVNTRDRGNGGGVGWGAREKVLDISSTSYM